MDYSILAEVEAAPIAVVRSHSAPRSLTRPFYRPELDAMRFFAFLAVFIHHGIYSVSPITSICGGFGLSLFFFLSAFLITELLQREKNLTGSVAVRAFYIRRVLRIWPLYMSFLVFAGVLGLAYPSHRITVGFLLSFLAMAGNLYIGRHGFPNTPAGFLWSISIEEQFYLLWPVLNRVCGAAFLRTIVFMFLPLGCMAVSILTAMHATPAIGIWTNSFAQFQMFSLGALLALALRGRVFLLGGSLRVALLAAGCMLWLTAARFSGIADRLPHPGPGPLAGYYLVGLGCAAFLMGVLGMPERWIPSQFVYLGKISYGLYVFHQLSLEVTAHLLNRTAFANSQAHHVLFGVGHICAGLLLTTGLAAASYRFLETPFLKLKDSFTIVRSRAI